MSALCHEWTLQIRTVLANLLNLRIMCVFVLSPVCNILGPQANHQHILLQGVDRLLLNMAEGVVCAPVPSGSAESQQSGGMYMSASEMTSSPQWRVIQVL